MHKQMIITLARSNVDSQSCVFCLWADELWYCYTTKSSLSTFHHSFACVTWM